MMNSIAVIGAACLSVMAFSTAVERADLHSEPEYREYLAFAEQAYIEGRYEDVYTLVNVLRRFDIHEVPTYEWRLFEIVLLIDNHELERARDELRAFADMLRIDSGVWQCDHSVQGISMGVVVRPSRVAYEQMCAEGYLAYYTDPARMTLRQVAEQWSLLSLVRDRLDLAEATGRE